MERLLEIHCSKKWAEVARGGTGWLEKEADRRGSIWTAGEAEGGCGLGELTEDLLRHIS